MITNVITTNTRTMWTAVFTGPVYLSEIDENKEEDVRKYTETQAHKSRLYTTAY